MQVNGEWLEHATEADIDKVLAGETVRRKFDWPKSPGEHDPLQERLDEGLDLDQDLQGGGRLQDPEEEPGEEARGHHRGGQEERPARARRGGLSHRPQVGLPAQGQPQAALPLRERGRERARDLQGPGHHRERPPPAHRGHRPLLPRASSASSPTSTSGASSTRASAPSTGRSRRPTPRATWARTSWAPGVDVDIVHPPRGRLVRVRRGDGAHREPGGQARPAAAEAALPRERGRLRLPDHRQQRGDALQRRRSSSTAGPSGSRPTGTEKNGGPKLYSISGDVVRPGSYEAPMGKITLRQLIYDYAGGMKPGRQAQGGDPRRILDPRASRGRDRRAHGLRQHRQGGEHARLRGHDRARRLAEHGGGGAQPHVLLQARVVRQVLALPRGHGLDAAAPGAAGGGAGGNEKDLDLLAKVCDSIAGKTVCPFGDAAIAPALSTMAKFRDEYDYYIREKGSWKRAGADVRGGQGPRSRGGPLVLSCRPSALAWQLAGVDAVKVRGHLRGELLPLRLHDPDRAATLAFMQFRLGPNRVGPFGLLQPCGGRIKLLFKEEVMPAAANKWAFLAGPRALDHRRLPRPRRHPLRAALPLFGREWQLQIADLGRRHPLHLRDHGARRVRDRARGLVRQQQVHAPRRPARPPPRCSPTSCALGLSWVGVIMLAGSFRIADIVDAPGGRLLALERGRAVPRLRRLLHRRLRGGEPHALRPAGGRDRARGRLPHRVLVDELRPPPDRRVHQHDHGLGARHEPVPGRLALRASLHPFHGGIPSGSCGSSPRSASSSSSSSGSGAPCPASATTSSCTSAGRS